MIKKDSAMKKGFTCRAFLNAGLALGIMLFTGAIGVPGVAVSAESGARGKKVGYVTFGLQFEYQVAMLEGIKQKAAAAGLVLNIIDGKGDPNAVLHFTVDGNPTLGTATADAGGTWMFTLTGLSDGSHTVVASETDAADNTGTASLTSRSTPRHQQLQCRSTTPT